jgi:uncharacterized protein YbjT (DUF2867 family)
VADHLVAAVQRGPTAEGRFPDIGGPELLRFGEMAQAWLAAQDMRRPLVHLPLPGKLSAGFRQGLNTVPQNRAGVMTWAEWLMARYPQSSPRDRNSTRDQATQGKIPI